MSAGCLVSEVEIYSRISFSVKRAGSFKADRRQQTLLFSKSNLLHENLLNLVSAASAAQPLPVSQSQLSSLSSNDEAVSAYLDMNSGGTFYTFSKLTKSKK